MQANVFQKVNNAKRSMQLKIANLNRKLLTRFSKIFEEFLEEFPNSKH